jgi:eukaryotic-like serine/threonine-protein kinase
MSGSVAAMTWELLTGKPPFGTGLKASFKIVGTNRPSLPGYTAEHPQFGPLSKGLAAVIMSCLKADPDDRPSADD